MAEYNSEKLEAVDAAHRLHNRKVQGSGAGSSSDMRDRPVFFDPKKYSADFTHRWDLQQEDEEWKRVFEVIMVKKTVCLICGRVIGSSPGLATAEEIEEHLKAHPPQEGAATMDALRCAVCDWHDPRHIREFELTKEDREYNKNGKLEVFRQWSGLKPGDQLDGFNQRKMSATHKAHRSAVKKVRAMLRATVKGIEKAVQKDGHILMVDEAYREFLKPTAPLPGEHHDKPAPEALSSEERERRKEERELRSEGEVEERELSSEEQAREEDCDAREEEPPSAPSEEDPATSALAEE